MSDYSKTIVLTVPPKLKTKFVRWCRSRGYTYSEAGRLAIRRLLDETYLSERKKSSVS